MRSLVFAVSVLIVGCGDDLRGLTIDELQAARTAAQCERYVRCGVVDDYERCLKSFRTRFDPLLVPAVTEGKIRFDPVAAESCFERLAARGCDITAAYARHEPVECARILVGTVPVDGVCFDDRECGTGQCNAPTCTRDACCPGKCAAFVAPAPIGAECNTKEPCIETAFCSSEGHCLALSAAGGSCRQDDECQIGLACTGATELEAGVCRALPKTGEECPYQRCAEIGAHCDGQTCVAFSSTRTCRTDSDCSPLASCNQATSECEPLPLLGDACQVGCAGDAWCGTVGGQSMCVVPQSNAAPCTANNECATQFCEEGPLFDQCAQPALCI